MILVYTVKCEIFLFLPILRQLFGKFWPYLGGGVYSDGAPKTQILALNRGGVFVMKATVCLKFQYVSPRQE